PSRGASVILQGEAPLGFLARHRPARPMAAALEALRVPETPDDVGAGPHAPRDDPQVPAPRAHGPLPREEDVLAVVVLPGDVVVMAVDGLSLDGERGNAPRVPHRANDGLHHQAAVRQGEVLRPADRLDVVVEVL